MSNHAEYGLSDQEYVTLLRQQNNVCALCLGLMSQVQIDHDHETGIVRGLLCRPCNTALGFYERFLKNADGWLEKADAYLSHPTYTPPEAAAIRDLWEPREGEPPLAAAARRLTLIGRGVPVPIRARPPMKARP